LAAGNMSDYGIEMVALRLRLLGHPTRIKLLRRLDQEDASVVALARSVGCDPGTAGSHLTVLYRAGIVVRVDQSGPAVFRLADWPSWWLVDQFAHGLATGARDFRHALEVDSCDC
jgi:DNA-binding transcriptional ArsR family regulator